MSLSRSDTFSTPGAEVFYIILSGKDWKVGEIGPYLTRDEASGAVDKVVATREGETLLNLLKVEKISVAQRYVT